MEPAGNDGRAEALAELARMASELATTLVEIQEACERALLRDDLAAGDMNNIVRAGRDASAIVKNIEMWLGGIVVNIYTKSGWYRVNAENCCAAYDPGACSHLCILSFALCSISLRASCASWYP